MIENDELNTAKLDISKNSIDFKGNKLDAFLQRAYDETVDVSHNKNCTFHSMGRNIWGMYLEDIINGIKNGLAERMIKKLIQKHGNKLKNPLWAHAGWHPFGSFAYRKSFLESVKYYFSNATFGWLNIFNPFFWLSELIWGEYVNDLYSINKSDEVELHIDKNLSEKEKYRIGNILGQLIREEIADAIDLKKSANINKKDVQIKDIKSGVASGFVALDAKNDNVSEQQKLKEKSGSKNEREKEIKKAMVDLIVTAYSTKNFHDSYVTQSSQCIVYEWQYLTSNDFLEETNENNPLETIVLEVNKKPISAENAKLVFNGSDLALCFSYNIDDIKRKLDEYKNIDKSKLPLICVIAEGFFIGRCQPIVGYKNKQEFIKNLLTAIEEECNNRVVSTHDKIKMLPENNKDKGTDIDSDEKNTNERL